MKTAKEWFDTMITGSPDIKEVISKIQKEAYNQGLQDAANNVKVLDNGFNNKKMNAKDYYEEMRKAGLTNDITSNDEPDYKLPFYQNIFRLMEGFSQNKKITPVTEFENVVRPVIKIIDLEDARGKENTQMD